MSDTSVSAEILSEPGHLQITNRPYIGFSMEEWAEELTDFGWMTGELVRRLMNFEWPSRKERDWRWVYVARSNDGIVKIGLSVRPSVRIAHLRYDNSSDQAYQPIALIPYCDLQHESALCRLLGPFAHRGREWFTDCPQTRSFCWHIASLRDEDEYSGELLSAELDASIVRKKASAA